MIFSTKKSKMFFYLQIDSALNCDKAFRNTCNQYRSTCICTILLLIFNLISNILRLGIKCEHSTGIVHVIYVGIYHAVLS